jgi:hypothetical protein
MTADKSPPLPDSVERVIAEMRDMAFADLIESGLVREWSDRLAALTDCAEPEPLHPQYRFGFHSGMEFEARNQLIAPCPSAALVGLAHKGPVDFANHECPSESAAVWNTCCMEHVRTASGLSLLPTTALSAVSATPGDTVDEAAMTPLDRCEFALRDASFDYDEAFRVAHLAYSTPAPAPAESLELVKRLRLEAAALIVTKGRSELASDVLALRDAADFIESGTTLRAVSGGREDDLASLDWPIGKLFTVVDEPGEHDPCWLVMPDGVMLNFSHHAINGVDQARAKFIRDACNVALTTPAAPALPDGWTPIETEWLRRLEEFIKPSCLTYMRRNYEAEQLAAAPQREEGTNGR